MKSSGSSRSHKKTTYGFKIHKKYRNRLRFSSSKRSDRHSPRYNVHSKVTQKAVANSGQEETESPPAISKTSSSTALGYASIALHFA